MDALEYKNEAVWKMQDFTDYFLSVIMKEICVEAYVSLGFYVIFLWLQYWPGKIRVNFFSTFLQNLQNHGAKASKS